MWVADPPFKAAFRRDGQRQTRGEIEIGAGFGPDNLAVSVVQGRTEAQAGAVVGERLFEVEASVTHVRGDARAAQVNVGDGFHPDRLPDPGRAVVMAAGITVGE